MDEEETGEAEFDLEEYLKWRSKDENGEIPKDNEEGDK